jgi:hypothetical protein
MWIAVGTSGAYFNRITKIPEARRTLQRHRHRWKDNIHIGIKEI